MPFIWESSRIVLCRSPFPCGIDSLHHEFNPILYPFIEESFDGLVLLGDWAFATVIVTSVLLAILLFFFVDQLRKGTKDFWMRILVG